MIDEGIIRNFWTAINTFKPGYNVFRIYLTLQNVTSDKKNEIIQFFINYKNTWAVISSKGEIDLTVLIWVKDNYDFYQFWSRTLDLFEDNFAKKIISLYIQTIDYKKTYLLNNEEKGNREHYRIVSSSDKAEIDNIDYRLL